MLNLFGPNQKLQVLLNGAAATTELPITVAYEERTAGPGKDNRREADGITIGATPVDIVPAPGSGKSRKVLNMSVYNADTASVVVTVRYSNADSGTAVTRILFKVTLLTLEALYFSEATGFYAVDASGFQKSNAPGSATATSTADSKAVLASSQVSSVQLSVSNTSSQASSMAALTPASVSSQASSVAAGIVVASINSVSSQASSMAAQNPNTVSSLQSGASVQSFTSTTWSTVSSATSRAKSSFGW